MGAAVSHSGWRDQDDDDLKAARGIGLGLVLSSVFWAVIALTLVV
jgi:hypothetical protein